MQSAVDTEHELRAQLREASTRGSRNPRTPKRSRARRRRRKQVAALTADLEAERRVVADLRSANAEREAAGRRNGAPRSGPLNNSRR